MGAAPVRLATRGEVARAALLLLTILGLLVAAMCRLVRLQVKEGAERAAVVTRRTERRLEEAAPRGRILDRSGRVLAEDLPVFEARAEVYLRGDGEAAIAAEASDLADDLAGCLLVDRPADTSRRVRLRRLLIGRIADAIASARERAARKGQAGAARQRIDFLIGEGMRSAAVVDALSDLERSRRWRNLHLHLTTRYERVYPGGDACVGPVGFVAERDGAKELRTRLEALDGLRGGVPASRAIRVGTGKQRFWTGRSAQAQVPASVITTLDLDLQCAAQAELEGAVADAKADRGSEPSWGALLLAEVDTGNVLAMASWVAGTHPRAAAFTPIQYRFEPGSVVKPLVFALALARGCVAWYGEHVDCSEGAPGRGWRVQPPVADVPRGTRPIVDDHACGVLTPHEILMRSSNVGAVRIGLRLGVGGLEDYVRLYRFGKPSGLGLLGESTGSCKADLAALPKREFWYYTAPSYCFGYEMMVTPAQLLRAYLSLLARTPRDLRLLAGAEVDGTRVDFPAPATGGESILSADQLDLLKGAMAAVVSEDEHATGRHVAQMLRRLGVAPGVVGGKTGTSVNRQSRIRTASFAGFAPVIAPRFVAFCVLQKDRAEGFYGGRYAAPAAARLLLHALGVLDPKTASVELAARAQQVSAVAPARGLVTPAESSTGR
ncbi:MAG: penicillin-binding transpeptidase domain-containing protein [Planctomycetota bacterium]